MKIKSGADPSCGDSKVYQLTSFYNNKRSISLKATKKFYGILTKDGFRGICVTERLRPKSGLFEVAVLRTDSNMSKLRNAKVGKYS